MAVLTIVTVNHNTAKFVELLLDALRDLTFHPYTCRIIDNGSREEDFRYLERVVKRHASTTLERRTGSAVLGELGDDLGMWSRLTLPLAGNLAHGVALNDLCRDLRTPYGVIVDSDCTFLTKHWDKKLIERLDRARASIVAAPAMEEPFPPFPSVRCLIFETTAIDGIDFRPLKAMYLDRVPAALRRLRVDFAALEGSLGQDELDHRLTFLDVGWHLARRCRTNGVRWVALDQRSANGRLGGLGGTETFWDDDVRVAAHYGRGAWFLAWKERPRSAFARLAYWSSVVLPAQRRRREARDKERWLASCRAIVEEERSKLG